MTEPTARWAGLQFEGVSEAETLHSTLGVPGREGRGLADTVRASDVGRKLAPSLVDTLSTLPMVDLVPRESEDEAQAEFSIVGLLGEGGMGRVVIARQRSLAREVAVKVRRPEAPASASAALVAEARAMGHLEHPAIVPVHTLGRDGEGNPVIVMKRVEGVSWSALLADSSHPWWLKLRSVSQDRRRAHLEILIVVCNAVHFAHSRGVFHRDLKPDNVLVGEFGEVYVSDWGIALARASVGPEDPELPTLAGTPVYMAPEMVSGDPRRVDARTDVYLLGAILHEILTGQVRNPGSTLAEVLRSASAPARHAYPASVPEELAAIANRATEARPEDRFPDVETLQRALVEHLDHQGSIALSDLARTSLEDLRAALAAPAADRGPATLASIERLATECRFGFLQALRAWPGNTAAAKGLRECLTALVVDHLQRGDAARARALTTEFEATPELLARIADLEREQARRALEQGQLAAQARQLDPGVAARERTRFLLVMGAAVAMVVTIGAVMALLGIADATLRSLVLIPLILLVVGGTALGVLAQRLATTLNRRTAVVVLVGIALVLIDRLLGLARGESVGAVLRSDALLLAAVFFTSAVTQHPLVALGGVPMMAVALFLPERLESQLIGFSLGIGTAIAITTGVSLWIAKQHAPGLDEDPPHGV